MVALTANQLQFWNPLRLGFKWAPFERNWRKKIFQSLSADCSGFYGPRFVLLIWVPKRLAHHSGSYFGFGHCLSNSGWDPQPKKINHKIEHRGMFSLFIQARSSFWNQTSTEQRPQYEVSMLKVWRILLHPALRTRRVKISLQNCRFPTVKPVLKISAIEKLFTRCPVSREIFSENSNDLEPLKNKHLNRF